MPRVLRPPHGECRDRQGGRQRRDVLEARRPAAEQVEAGALRRQRQPADVLPALILDDDGHQQDAGEAERCPDEGRDIDGRVLALAHAPPGRPHEQAGQRHQEQTDPMQSARRGQHPDHRPDRRAREHAPAERPPAAHANDAQRPGGDRQEIAEQDGRVGRLAADDGGTDEAADEGQRRHQDAVAQRQADGEGGERRGTAACRDLGDHLVERHRREQRAVERSDAGGGQRLGDPVVAAAHPLGAADQGEAEQRGQDHPDLGREVSLFDRVAHEEDRRERQGDRADPQEGARAQALLPTDRYRFGNGCRQRRRRDLGPVPGLRRFWRRFEFKGRRGRRHDLRRRYFERRRQYRTLPPSAAGAPRDRPSANRSGSAGATCGRAPRWRGWACREPRRSRARSGGFRPRCPRGRHALPATRRRRGWPGGRTPRGCPWRRCRASPPCDGSPCAPHA